mmetsp:Transcript_17551/g.36356  ORF Transcript_17551/g.36356 Transcript_17551/m.36356 type:complete len:179 (+) Transcript_17551:114-650(+)
MIRCAPMSLNFRRCPGAFINPLQQSLKPYVPFCAPFHVTRNMSNLPDHTIVGMPALSPTMESGTLSKWSLKEGSTFNAGDVLAEIETDKASIDFVTEDDGVVAKFLVKEGATDVKVGDPIIVIVEEESHVPAFADFSVSSTPSDTASSSPSPPPPPATTTTTTTITTTIATTIPPPSP